MVDSTNPDHSASCILGSGLGFSGDAFLHLGEVPSVQVSPHHWRPSNCFCKAKSLERRTRRPSTRILGLVDDTYQQTDKGLMELGFVSEPSSWVWLFEPEVCCSELGRRL